MAKKKAKPKPKVKDPFKAQVDAAVRAKYDPATSDLTGQIKASAQQQKNITGWFGDYLKQVNDAEARTNQGYYNSSLAIAQTADKSTAVDRSNRQQMLAEMQADAAKRGATVDPKVGVVGAQAEASRRAGLDEALAGNVRTAANQNAYLLDRGRIGGRQSIQAHLDETGRQRLLVKQRTELKQQRADYGTQIRGQLEDQAFKNQIAQAGLGIKAGSLRVAQQNASTNAFSAKTRAAIAAGKLRLDGSKFASAQEKDAYQRAHRLGPYKPAAKPRKPAKKAESASSIKARGAIASAVGRYRDVLRHFRGDHAKTARRLRSEFNELTLLAAADIVAIGRIRPGHAQALRNLGVRIPKNGRPY